MQRNRLVILLIALICVVPFAIAWYLSKNPELVEDRQKSNYGHLIVPARPFEYADFFHAPITPAENLPEIKGRWVLVQIASGPTCQDLCRETAHKTGQLRLMLNKEIPRVRRLLLLPDPADSASIKALAATDPTLLIAGLPETLRRRLQDAVGEPLADGMVLLMDPFANLMMWYEPGFDPYGALRDLQRLLKASQIG
ncbi:MAG TPA: hypothetical protein VLU73_08530 [Methylococcaceae bacterium]|jgi:hypothetical protein|nr:hypothetical protein [Methylococcaceae bacterium]